MAGLASSALLGSRLPMPRSSRCARTGAAAGRATKPLRVAAVLEDTSKKNDSLSISKDILDKVCPSTVFYAFSELAGTSAPDLHRSARWRGRTPKLILTRLLIRFAESFRQLFRAPPGNLPEPDPSGSLTFSPSPAPFGPFRVSSES